MATILGIGGVCVDRVLRIPRMPDWDDVEPILSVLMQQGGMAATAIVAAARLGEDVEFIGGIGDDEAGQYALDVFSRERIKTDRVKTFAGEQTAFSVVLVHETSGKRTILNYRGVQRNSNLQIAPLDLSGVRFLHLDGYWFDTALHTAKQAKAQGITITVDPSSGLLQNPTAEELFCLTDYLMPGLTFAQSWTGEQNPFVAADCLLKYGGKAVIITQGSDGCILATREEHLHLPAFPVNVVDTTGAGDTFHGAFVAGLSKGYDLPAAVRFASAVAALKCTKPGGQAGIPTYAEVQSFIKANAGITAKTLRRKG